MSLVRENMEINLRPLLGNWTHGWALDQHTVSSTTGDSGSFDRPAFATERSEIGEAIFKLKYRDDLTQVEPIAQTVAGFIRGRSELCDIKAILAVPPSDGRRRYQPVEVVAARVGALLGLPAPDDYLFKSRETQPLMGIAAKRRRRQELDDAFAVRDKRFTGQHVLLFDDLYRSGGTLKAVTVALLFQGSAAMVSVVAATSTRSNR
jgi:competence protein ComFC